MVGISVLVGDREADSTPRQTRFPIADWRGVFLFTSPIQISKATYALPASSGNQ